MSKRLEVFATSVANNPPTLKQLPSKNPIATKNGDVT